MSKAVTLFSGLGSSSKALRDLGFTVLPHDMMVEACDTLASNGFQPTLCNVKDVDFTAPRYANVEVLAGGPPCQPFSQSADNDGQYDKRDMIPEFLRAISEMLPSLFVMEEVQTLTWKKHAAYFAMVVDHMETLGYAVEYRIVNAANHGYGQARKRLFVVGVRLDVAQSEIRNTVLGGPIAWPDHEDADVTMADILGWDEEECRLRNKMAPVPAQVDDDRCLWPLNRSSTTVVGTFRPEVQAVPGYRKAGDGPRQNQPGSVVTTIEERLLLQDMPTDWIVRGSQSKRDLQVGNSVPCGLIRDIIDINIH